ncbi:asparagine synthase-related protein [Actinomyces vulturis]|uniref:asparagine synthase-related protein n=1 Tax=Actinomyces vulturis TaxID=1857645 RepID=UPI00082F9399|nr:asparagine synthase-related protein [Actinomyces vulturis]
MPLVVTTLLTSPQWQPVHASETDSPPHHSRRLGYIRADHPLTVDDLSSPDVMAHHPERAGGIIISDDEVLIVQDRLRSWPLLWTILSPDGEDPVCVISDDANALNRFSQQLGSSSTWNIPARDEFLDTGFVTGTDTLVRTISSAPQGVMVRINRHTHDVTFHPYALSYFLDESIESPGEFSEFLSQAFDRSMTTLMNRVGSRRLLIPLSGGLDSRLLVSWLKKNDVSSALTFTYGVSGSREAQVSQQVAQQAGLPWHFIEYEPEAMLRAWHSEQTHEFFRYSSGFNALPHVQDWFALQSLDSQGMLDNDVVLPGHTIVGNMHDHELLHRQNVTHGDLGRALIAHHNILQEHSHQALSDDYRIAKVARYLRMYGHPHNYRYVQSVIESYNVHERQTKYINNSVRAYEFMGLDWALPMLDAPMWHGWAHGSEQLTATRDFYRSFVNYQWAQALGNRSELAYYEVTPLASETREKIKRVLDRAHVLPLAERSFSSWSSMHSAMSFDRLVTDCSRATMAAKLMQGRMTLGFWTRSFLGDTWSRGSTIFKFLHEDTYNN